MNLHDAIDLLHATECESLLDSILSSASSDKSIIEYDLTCLSGPSQLITSTQSSLVYRKHLKSLPVGPVPAIAQEQLIRLWLESRLQYTFNDSTPLYDYLYSGLLLIKLLQPNSTFDSHATNRSLGIHGLQPLLYNQQQNTIPNPHFKRNLDQFLKRASKYVPRHCLFDPNDLLLLRDYPKVLRALSMLARKLDHDGYLVAAQQVPSCIPVWDIDQEPNERWDGDDKAHDFLSDIKKSCPELNSLRLVIGGSLGNGKSATINRSILNRFVVNEHHSVDYMKSQSDIISLSSQDTDLQLKKQHNFDAKQRQRLWPIQLYEHRAQFSKEPLASVVKCADVMLRIVELPSMETFVDNFDDERCSIMMSGQFSKVQVQLEHESAFDVILVVERCDDLKARNNPLVYRHLRRLFGENVWNRMIVVLTHAQCVVPKDMTREQLIEHRVSIVKAAIYAACFPMNVFHVVHVFVSFCFGRIFKHVDWLHKEFELDVIKKIPIVLVENSQHPHAKHAAMRGSEHLLSAMKQIIVDRNDVRDNQPKLKARKARVWWRECISVVGIIWVLNLL